MIEKPYNTEAETKDYSNKHLKDIKKVKKRYCQGKFGLGSLGEEQGTDCAKGHSYLA